MITVLASPSLSHQTNEQTFTQHTLLWLLGCIFGAIALILEGLADSTVCTGVVRMPALDCRPSHVLISSDGQGGVREQCDPSKCPTVRCTSSTCPVGTHVQLTPDYASYGDASSGPLRPGDVGEVTGMSSSSGRPRVQSWYFDNEALETTGGGRVVLAGW